MSVFILLLVCGTHWAPEPARFDVTIQAHPDTDYKIMLESNELKTGKYLTQPFFGNLKTQIVIVIWDAEDRPKLQKIDIEMKSGGYYHIEITIPNVYRKRAIG